MLDSGRHVWFPDSFSVLGLRCDGHSHSHTTAPIWTVSRHSQWLTSDSLTLALWPGIQGVFSAGVPEQTKGAPKTSLDGMRSGLNVDR